ncbi:MAG: hypothetical protein M3535_08390 [Actinomycetota bacterium]|nr:hypothetical protein [Actinomycetota bacterium]
MLEPLAPDVPPRRGSLAALGPLRLSAAGAVTVLALSSTGHVVVLAALLAVLVAQPLAVGAVLLAGLAVLERWGTPSLEAIVGAQSVLGAGGVVGPATAAASAWFAAAALVLASPRADGHDDDMAGDGDDDHETPSRRRLSRLPRLPRLPRPRPAALVTAVATGSTAALVVAGPAFSVDLPVRLGATAVAVVVAAAVSSLRWQQATAALALVAALVAAALGAAVTNGRVGL